MGSNNYRNAPVRARLHWGVGGLLSLPLPLALLISTPAGAQPASPACAVQPAGAARVIRPGSCVRSTLDAQDSKISTGDSMSPEIPYEDWTLTLRAGETVRIEMDAVVQDQPSAVPAQAEADTPLDMGFGFDTLLELRRPGVEEPLERNDDRPGSLNSRIDFTATVAGDYIVRARPLWNPEAGDYLLRVGAPPPRPVAIPLADGVTNASIGTDVPASEMLPEYRAALYGFDGVAGERVRISAGSSAPTMMMELAGPDGIPIASAFQDAVDTNAPPVSRPAAAMMAVLPTAGRYELLVYVPVSDSATPLTLNLERRRSVAERAPRRIRLGETVEGEIGLESSLVVDQEGIEGGQSFAELYELPVRAGQPVQIEIDSGDLAQMIEAGVMSPLGFAAAVSGIAGGGAGALVLTPTQAGTITLRVRPLGNAGGRYRLSVRPAEASPPAQ